MVSLTTLLSAAALALTVLADKYLYLADCGPSQTFVLAMYSKGSEPGKQQKPDSVKIVGNDNPSFSFEAAELTATSVPISSVSVF
ncbi:hypothetical protein G7Y89_g7027 [Cudoniella acicularis]|uniref:Uncharacterized protein n=1 Tax=Cudoniella acicularis TaxID=354080 RepID=A0A8H4RLX1_9HELO|nr:hypothetical protein G7Y89_g7027 [Cudoniella acicularis]